MTNAAAAYRLDELGWLQFERLCASVLQAEAEGLELRWLGHADRGRVARLERALPLPGLRRRIRAPLAVAAVWVPSGQAPGARLSELISGLAAVPSHLGDWTDRVVLLTNLDAEALRAPLERRYEGVALVVLGAAEIGRLVDRHPGVRAAMPSVLGLRDLAGLVDPAARERSSFDIEAAQTLARVFWPTRAYGQTRTVLADHGFAVLAGPPEMGKTAIARMIALAQLTHGWEAYECSSPGQIWTAFDAERPQVFIADDAFGSTEYRPESAELWARELARLLERLDRRHWLIWTSRPAPLKAALARLQRERGLAALPPTAAVLVDAGAFDLAEKTLILFRHAKARRVSGPARTLLRRAGVSIVEHEHFTPERIRRFVGGRLEDPPAGASGLIPQDVLLRAVEQELTRPTDAMRTSFAALEDGYRELLIALLDAPAGFIDERELVAIVRRHHGGGLRRPASELIDRLTDHFLRHTTLGIGWVHPSWRDLVIEELRADAPARRAFLSVCGVHGAMLAISSAGGVAGERDLPLLLEDGDWDALGDRLCELIREGDHETVLLLVALREAAAGPRDRRRTLELESLAAHVLESLTRQWNRQRRVLPVAVVEAWYALSAALEQPGASPELGPTWTELLPPATVPADGLTRAELAAVDEWLALAQVLARFDREALKRLGFFTCDRPRVIELAVWLARGAGGDLRPLAESVMDRIARLDPAVARAHLTLRALRSTAESERKWFVPEDIAAPPTHELASLPPPEFTPAEVRRVLADL